MVVSREVGLASLQGGAVLMASVVLRGICTRHLTHEMVPTVLRSRIQLRTRLAPTMLLIAAALVVVGALICVVPS
jgi:hypothetical protein